ncbi:MAG: carboxypeptidase-like regulatory domain-containing protein [Longimicrobiales bacterium]|nr:carboxypeptidase-like regulatory domain-containing protein [Longimicrobiales bacterium]
MFHSRRSGPQALSGGAVRQTSLLCVLACLLGTWPAAASAQALVVRVTEAETARPILGAFVSLFGEDGSLLASALTNAEGRALVSVREAGAVRVRAQMIGRETRDSRLVLPPGGDAVFHELALPVLALPLTGIEVVGSARCALRREEGEAVLAVWEEARKALEVAAWSLEIELFRYQIELRTREYDPEGRSVWAEKREVLSGYYREPFVSRPASDLAERGFVQQTDKGPLAFAPGAAVLLSDPFLDTHCFRPQSAGGDALIGLGFEPLPRRRVPDIRGVIWVDRGTGDLRSVEFAYTGFPEVGARGESGGSVEFERLPSGAWIVRRWWIRMPIMEEMERMVLGARVLETRRIGTQEEAGEVVGIRDREGTVVATSERAFLGGVVFDSVRGVPLAGARVFLAGTGREARSDGGGRFRIPDLPPGIFTVDVAHPDLDSLGLEVVPREMTVEEGGMSWVELAVPRFSPAEAPDVQGVRGWVQDPGGSPAQGIFVTLLREDGSRIGAGLSDSQGEFRIPASVPEPLHIRLEAIGHSPRESAGFELPPGHWLTTMLRYSEPRVDLGASVASGSAACIVGPEPTSPTGRALEEVRKALSMEVWTRKSDRLEHEIVLFRRERSPRDLEVWEDTLRAVEGFVEPSFPTRPPELLREEGFAPKIGDTTFTYAPIPEVVLSGAFLADHCFRIDGGSRPGDTLSLVFEPVRRREGVVDVRGAFLIDRRSGELRSLHYRYTDFPGPKAEASFTGMEPPAAPGGWMSFQRLPEGSWMVSDWGSRQPMLISLLDTTRTDPTPNLAVFAVEEVGGVVTTTRSTLGDTLWTGPLARASALAADSAWAAGAEPPARGRTAVPTSSAGRLAGGVVAVASFRWPISDLAHGRWPTSRLAGMETPALYPRFAAARLTEALAES